jgi:uncharacterized protein YdcH (DUF465 family)
MPYWLGREEERGGRDADNHNELNSTIQEVESAIAKAKGE